MDSLLTLIDSRIAQSERNDMSIKSVPCRVEEILDNGYVKIKAIPTGAEYELLNKSGTSVSVGESVQVYYCGVLNSKSAYVGAAIGKESESPLNMVVGETQLIEIFDSELVIATCDVSAKKDTVGIMYFNITLWGINGGNTLFEFVINDETILTLTVTTHIGEYVSQSFSIPTQFENGDSSVQIKAKGDGLIAVSDLKICGHGIEEAEPHYDPTTDTDYVYETETEQTNVIYYIGKSLHPSVPLVINNQPVKILRGTAFNYSNITTVYIPEGVEEIE